MILRQSNLILNIRLLQTADLSLDSRTPGRLDVPIDAQARHVVEPPTILVLHDDDQLQRLLAVRDDPLGVLAHRAILPVLEFRHQINVPRLGAYNLDIGDSLDSLAGREHRHVVNTERQVALAQALAQNLEHGNVLLEGGLLLHDLEDVLVADASLPLVALEYTGPGPRSALEHDVPRRADRQDRLGFRRIDHHQRLVRRDRDVVGEIFPVGHGDFGGADGFADDRHEAASYAHGTDDFAVGLDEHAVGYVDLERQVLAVVERHQSDLRAVVQLAEQGDVQVDHFADGRLHVVLDYLEFRGHEDVNFGGVAVVRIADKGDGYVGRALFEDLQGAVLGDADDGGLAAGPAVGAVAAACFQGYVVSVNANTLFKKSVHLFICLNREKLWCKLMILLLNSKNNENTTDLVLTLGSQGRARIRG